MCGAISRVLLCATFRIFQETLTYIARHAGATEVEVRLVNDTGDLPKRFQVRAVRIPAGPS
jgi:signal transduction histidine kinase